MRYSIADHIVELNLIDTKTVAGDLRSFLPFVTESGGDALLCITVDDKEKAYPKDSLRLIRDVDTGNGVISVFRHVENGEDVGYQFVIRDMEGQACALLKAYDGFADCRCALRGSANARAYGLNSAIMLSYAFAAASHKTLLMHASMVRHDGKAYAFVAKSGTGKSTQVSNWLRNIENCDLMNDDNPIFRVTESGVVAYGSPWSGKTPCYRQVMAPLGGVAKIVRDNHNELVAQQPVAAFTELLSSCSMMKWDVALYKNVSATISSLVGWVKVYELHCLPDADSARVAQQGMKHGGKHRDGN